MGEDFKKKEERMSRKNRGPNYQKEYLSVDCRPIEGEGERCIYQVQYHDQHDRFFLDREKAFASLVQGLARRNDNEAIYVDRRDCSDHHRYYYTKDMEKD